MHLRTVLYTCILILTLGLAAQAGSVPELISHQGRLLKADGTPESGAHSLTFKVYEASSGGVALWTESHPGVVVDEGLFTVLLGSTVPVTSDLLSPSSSGSPVERWLEVAVDGQVLLPRMRLATTPYAATSSRVDGDVETSQGELRLHGMSGSTTATIRSSQNPATPGSELVLTDGNGSTTGTIKVSVDSSGFKFGAVSGAHFSSWTSADQCVATVSNASGSRGIVTAVKTTGRSGITVVEDGLESASLETNDDSTSLHLTSKRDGEVFVNNFDVDLSEDITRLAMGTDSDGDAHHENQLTATATFTDGSTMDITSDSDDDGIANGQAQMKSKGSSGAIRLGGMSGSTTGTIRMAATPDSTYEDHSSLDAQGYGGTTRGMNSNVRSTALLGVDRSLRHTSIEQTCDSTSARGVFGGMSGSTTGTIRMMASADSTRNYLDMDDDGDGYAESDARIRLTPIDAEMGLSTDRFAAGPRQTVSMDGSFSHAQSRCISDFDRDGKLDVVVAARSDSSGGGNYLDMDSDDDGVSDCSARSMVTDDSATFRLTKLPPGTPYIGNFTVSTSGPITKGSLSGMSGSTTGTIRMMATPDSAADYLDMDSDNDGISESSTKQYVDGSLAASSLAGRSGSTTATIRMSSSGGGGGGSLSPTSELVMDADSDGDGVADHDITADCDDQDARIRVTNIGSSGQDGVSIEASSSSRRVRLGNLGSSGQDGVDMEVGSSLRRLTVGNIGSSGQDGVSIEVDGTSRRLTVGNIGSSGQDGVAMEVDASTSRLVVHNIGSSGQDGVSFEATSTGAHMGLDTIPGTAKIAVGGGAYCDGTNWVNASDVNSKENFESVNGAEVLDRLADLKITRWNYKSQPGVEHIGPTAQDFQAAFGVGANDKSISTIDPSGIALAAIKELQKQNANLRGENAELREALEALSRKVDALVATQ